MATSFDFGSTTFSSRFLVTWPRNVYLPVSLSQSKNVIVKGRTLRRRECAASDTINANQHLHKSFPGINWQMNTLRAPAT